MGYVEGVEGAERSNLESGDAVVAVVHGAGRAGEVKNVVDFADIERLADIFFDKFEARLVAEVGDVREPAGEQIVDDDHIPAFGQQGIA
jgi:hypothetical protein